VGDEVCTVLTGRGTAAANPTRLIRRAQPLEPFSWVDGAHPVAASTGRRRQQAAGVNSRTACARRWTPHPGFGRARLVGDWRLRIGLSHAMVDRQPLEQAGTRLVR
jgi:hypothetical protein